MTKSVKTIFVIWGVSGAGKTSLANALVQHGKQYLHCNIAKIKTMTTRPKRTPDEDDYHFVTKRQFQQMQTFASTCFAGNYYGTSLTDVQRQLKHYYGLVIILTWSGVQHYVQMFQHTNVRVIPVFLDCSLQDAFARLTSRKDQHISDKVISRRFQSFRQQLETAEKSSIESCTVESVGNLSPQANHQQQMKRIAKYMHGLN